MTTQLTSEQCEALSIEISQTKLFFPFGNGKEVKYVGEIYLVLDSRHKCTNECRKRHSGCKIWMKPARKYLTDHNLPFPLNPLEAGWRPPYFDDAEILEWFNRPIGEILRPVFDYDEYPQFALERFHMAGIHYVGQLFTPMLYDQWFFLFVKKVQGPIREKMYIPSDWKPPQGVPAEWMPYYRKQQAEVLSNWEKHPQRIELKGKPFGDDVSMEVQWMFARMGILDTETIATMPEEELAARLRRQPGTYPGQNFSQMWRPFQLTQEFVLQHRPNVNPQVFPCLDTNSATGMAQ